MSKTGRKENQQVSIKTIATKLPSTKVSPRSVKNQELNLGQSAGSLK